MESSKVCIQFQEDLRGVLFDGSNLKNEDSILFEFISNLENPREVLAQSENYKKEGNSSFKEGDVDGALEKYSLACVFLSCVVLNEEEARKSFLQLATNTILNMAASLLKKNEFSQVGQLCSIVLEFNPENVKALFRRATAALGLGKNELASWDLKLAHEVEPSNQEVVKKLREVERLMYESHYDYNQGKEKRLKQTREMVTSNSRDQNEGEAKVDPNQGQDERTNCSDGKRVGRMFGSIDDGTSVVELNQVRRESFSKEVEMSEGDDDSEVKVKANTSRQEVRKSKFHFHNKRRAGSTLAISKDDYHVLAQGRTLQHYNPRTGIVMSIRIKGSSQEKPIQPKELQPHQNPLTPPTENFEHIPQKDINTHNTKCPITPSLPVEKPSSFPEAVMREQHPEDAPLYSVILPADIIIPSKPSPTHFQSITTGNPLRKAKHRPPFKEVKKGKRNLHRKSSCVSSNHVFQCRSKVASSFQYSDHHLPSFQVPIELQNYRKRKPNSFQNPDSLQRPWKFITISVACNFSSIDVFSSSKYMVNSPVCMNCVRI